MLTIQKIWTLTGESKKMVNTIWSSYLIYILLKQIFICLSKYFSMTSYDLINSKLYIYFHPTEIFYIINFLSYIVYIHKLSQFSNKQVNQIRATARIFTHHFLPKNCKPYRFFEYIFFQNLWDKVFDSVIVIWDLLT